MIILVFAIISFISNVRVSNIIVLMTQNYMMSAGQISTVVHVYYKVESVEAKSVNVFVIFAQNNNVNFSIKRK